MNKITSNYWDKKVKIPFKYRKAKNIIKALLRQVEKDRDEGISMSPISIDYNIKYKYLIFECLEKYFELKLVSVPVSHKLGLYKQPLFCLVDINSRENAWYDKCLLNPVKAIDLIAYRIKNCLDNCLDCLSHVDVSDICYCVNVPEHIFVNAFDKIKSNVYLRHATYQTFVNDGNTYYYINIIKCYEKAEEPEKIDAKKGVNGVKVIAITEDQNILLRSVEKEREFRWNISNLINGLENAYNSDSNYLKESKNINKPTLINWVTNNLNFNEKEIELIKTLMRRKGFNISCEYDKNKQLNFKIESLNDKERRLKNIETMTTYTKMYGYGIEKIDFRSNDIQIMLEDIDYDRCNIINKETKWKDVQFKTVISELSKEYGEYLEI